MLKCKVVKENGHVRVKAKGSPNTLAVESCAIIMDCFKELNRQYPAAADEYKRTVLGMMLDPSSPVWKEESPND